MVSVGRAGPAETGVGGLVTPSLGDLKSGRGRDEVLSRASSSLLSILDGLRGSSKTGLGSGNGDTSGRGRGFRGDLIGSGVEFGTFASDDEPISLASLGPSLWRRDLVEVPVTV